MSDTELPPDARRPNGAGQQPVASGTAGADVSTGEDLPPEGADTDRRAAQKELLHKAGKNWWAVLALGVLSLLAGLAMVVWPGRTVVVLAALLGAWLVVSGVFQLIHGFDKELSGGQRALSIVLGLLSLALGVMCFAGGLVEGVYVLSLFIGFSFIFRGIWQVLAGVQGKGAPGRMWFIVGGALSLLAGIVVLIMPLGSLTVLALIAGIWMIIIGAIEIFYAFQIKSVTGN